MGFSLALAVLAVPLSMQAACPATAADAVEELGPAVHEHTFDPAVFGPGLARHRSFHRPAGYRLGQPVAYAWTSRNQAGVTTEVVYRLGTGHWTVGETPHALAPPFRDAYPTADCEPSGCFATLARRGAALGDLEGADLAPVARVIGAEGLALIGADLATIDETEKRYPVVLRCRYRFREAGAPVPMAR